MYTFNVEHVVYSAVVITELWNDVFETAIVSDGPSVALILLASTRPFLVYEPFSRLHQHDDSEFVFECDTRVYRRIFLLDNLFGQPRISVHFAFVSIQQLCRLKL
ncbi:hypothetical protein D3C77_497890 [compost metagenome]